MFIWTVKWTTIVVCKLDLSIENYELKDVHKWTICCFAKLTSSAERDDLCRLSRLNGTKGFSLKLNVGHKIKCPGHPRMNTALIRSDCKAILMFTFLTRTHRGRVSNDIKIKFQRACLNIFALEKFTRIASKYILSPCISNYSWRCPSVSL